MSVSQKHNRSFSFLGRITVAIKEQNWFTVALEVVIVVMGVLIAFQISAWGQRSSDRAKEQSYLLQLAQDLRQTQATILVNNASMKSIDGANSKLLHAYLQPGQPSADSIATWFLASMWYRPLTPVTATAEALIASGDISLIQNDVLRSKITAYVPVILDRVESTNNDISKWWDQVVSVANRYDIADMFMTTVTASEIDSASNADPYYRLPVGNRVSRFPVDHQAMLNDRQAYNSIRSMLDFKGGMARNRRMVLEPTVELLALLEAELKH